MKRLTAILVAILFVFSISTADIFARGGRGGGGARGGASRGGGARPSINRSPSMNRQPSSRYPVNRPTSRPVSRPSTRPNTRPGNLPSTRPGTRPGNLPTTRPGTRPGTLPSTRPGTRPSQGDLGRFLDLPRYGNDRAGLQNRRDNLPGGGDKFQPKRDNVSDRRDNIGENRQDRISQRHDRLHQRGDHIRNHRPRNNFWLNNPNWARWRFTRPYRWATWGALTGWFGWGAGYGESYYDYGGDVYYDDQNVYYGDETLATTQEYADQASDIAAAGAQTLEDAIQSNSEDELEWMSLGVFALTHEEKGDPIMYFQMAVAKDGTIGGTYYNSQTKETKSIQGSIDKKTQRAVWTVGDKSSTVIETGIYNLTKDETSVLMHFKDGKTQTWLMVRMEDPESKSTR